MTRSLRFQPGRSRVPGVSSRARVSPSDAVRMSRSQIDAAPPLDRLPTAVPGAEGAR